MEKRGVIGPAVTPPEHGDTVKIAVVRAESCEKSAIAELAAIRELDGDFRKLAADTAKKAL